QLECKETYGYITKSKRIEQELEKSHHNDAFVIANGSTQTRCKKKGVSPKKLNLIKYGKGLTFELTPT
ncbi:MAG: hypothetical protein U9N77_17265, partial [Thermodesulfobacteriota bacterium]|nr:hypothetical protein [Thermodesulfobacteriota bacterium]